MLASHSGSIEEMPISSGEVASGLDDLTDQTAGVDVISAIVSAGSPVVLSIRKLYFHLLIIPNERYK